MVKKTEKPKFVCYENGTPFRVEGSVIYGPKIVPPSVADPVAEHVSHYECFICDCDNEVVADALVVLLNQAFNTGKKKSEEENSKEEKSKDGSGGYPSKVRDDLNKEVSEKEKAAYHDMQKFIERMEERKAKEKIKPIKGHYEQRWDL